MKLSLTSAIYCVDEFFEHVNLIDSIQRGVCLLDRKLIPERDEEHFKPYMIDSMEFEFLELIPNKNIMKRISNKSEKSDKPKSIYDNLLLGPVSNVHNDVLKRLEHLVKTIKCCVDLKYFLFFNGGHQAFSVNYNNAVAELGFLALLAFV